MHFFEFANLYRKRKYPTSTTSERAVSHHAQTQVSWADFKPWKRFQQFDNFRWKVNGSKTGEGKWLDNLKTPWNHFIRCFLRFSQRNQRKDFCAKEVADSKLSWSKTHTSGWLILVDPDWSWLILLTRLSAPLEHAAWPSWMDHWAHQVTTDVVKHGETDVIFEGIEDRKALRFFHMFSGSCT